MGTFAALEPVRSQFIEARRICPTITRLRPAVKATFRRVHKFTLGITFQKLHCIPYTNRRRTILTLIQKRKTHLFIMADKLDDVRPMFELRGRNYLITGGAQGIGFATTRAICEMGGNVAVLDIQESPVEEFKTLASKYGVKTSYHQTDLTKQDSLNAGFASALEALGSIDGCVPAAGIAIDKPFVDQTWDEFTRIQDINVGLSFVLRGKHLLNYG